MHGLASAVTNPRYMQPAIGLVPGPPLKDACLGAEPPAVREGQTGRRYSRVADSPPSFREAPPRDPMGR
jgi:hypothetical protein